MQDKLDIIYARLPIYSERFIYSVGCDGSVIRTSKKLYRETKVARYTKHGKATVKLSNREYHVKKLVAQAFLPHYQRDMSITHKDGNPLNCRSDNLVLFDKYTLGRVTGGDSRRKAVIYNGDEFYSVRECAKALNCSYQTLSDYLNGKVKHSVLQGVDVKYDNAGG